MNKINLQGTKKRRKSMWASITVLFVIIFLIILISWILQWTGVTVQAESFATLKPEDTGWKPEWTLQGLSEVTIKNPATTQSIKGLGILDLFVLPLLGVQKQAGIIVFLLTMGGFIMIVVKTKALQAMAISIANKLKGKEFWVIIPLMIFFSLCGTIEGMADDSLPFYIIIIPIIMIAGFDKFTGFLILFLGTGLGVVGSTLNPFAITTAIQALNSAKGVIDFITLEDGIVWRLIVWILLTIFGIGFTVWYALRSKNNNQLSFTFHTYEKDVKVFLNTNVEKLEMDWRRKTTLAILGLSFLFMLVYLISWDRIFGTTAMKDSADWVNQNLWFITRLIPGFGYGNLIFVAAFFLIASIILAFVNGLGEKEFLKQFYDGAKDFIGLVFLLGAAAGITIALSESSIEHLVTNGLKLALNSVNNPIAKVLMLFIIFLPISFIIPAMSGFALTIFPLLISVVSDQSADGTMSINPSVGSGAILAFVMAHGFVNMISPMSPVLAGGLTIAQIDYGTFIKKMWPFFTALLGLLILFLILGVLIADPIYLGLTNLA